MTISWKTIGNVSNCVNIALVSCFAVAIFVFGEQLLEKGVLDPNWFEDGYCTAEGHSSADQMHFEAGLSMVATFVPIALLLFVNAGRVALEEKRGGTKNATADDDLEDLYTNVKYGMVGIVSHAIAHFLIWEAIRAGIFPDGDTRGIDDLKQSSVFSVVRKILPGFVMFFVPIMKSYMRHTSLPVVVLLAFVAQTSSLHLPMKYGFSCALSYFFAGFSLDQLLFVPTHKKNFAYAIYPLLTVIPSILLAWFEATSCTSSSLLVKHGHSLFDSWVGVSYSLYAGITHLYVNNTSKADVKKIV